MRIYKTQINKTKLAGLSVGLAFLAQALVPILSPAANAANLTNAYVRLDRLATAQDTTWELDFKPATAGATSLSVNFSGSWTSNSGTVNATQAIGACTDNSDTQLPGSPTASGSGSTVTVSSITALSNSTQYCEAFTTSNSVHTPTAGAYTFTVTVGSDSSSVATTIVGAGADQVTVTATVNPSFSMSLNTTTDALGTITTGAVKTSSSAVSATINTNAANGWYLWGKDSNAGLKSTTAGNYTIASNCSSGAGTNTTLSAGTEGYNLGASVGTQGSGSGGTAATSGTGLVFDNASGTAGKGAGLCSTNYQPVAKSTGTANGARIDMLNNAAISGVTKPATDYTDLETFVGAGVF